MDYDFSTRESLLSRLIAAPNDGSEPIVAKIINFVPRHVYTILTLEHELQIHLRKASGGGMATHDRYAFDITENNGVRGRIDYFPNNDFVLTRHGK
jgi:hypothetical protein